MTTTTTTKTTYTCCGSVRGCCGVTHRTLKAALACQRKDQAACKSQGGYSDRSTIAYEDGVRRKLTENEVYDGGY